MKEGEQLTPADLEQMRSLFQELEKQGGIIIEGQPTDALMKYFQQAAQCREYLGLCIGEIAALWQEHGHPVCECPSKSGPHHDLFTDSANGTVFCGNKGCEQRWKPDFPKAA